MTLLRLFNYSFMIACLIFADRITKAYALTHYLNRSCVINKYLCFVTEFNQGSSLGILSGNSHIQKLFLLIAPLIPILILCIYHFNTNTLACSLIIAGGFSNLYDRILYSGVIDFILISIGNSSFPLFNIADLLISLGAIILFYQLIYNV